MAGKRKLISEFTEADVAAFRKAFVTGKLRQASFFWPWRTIATQRARRARGRYECALCRKAIGNGEKKLDHIFPVVDPGRGFVSFDEFITRLFVTAEGWQVLCKPCHDRKTKTENALRKRGKKS